MSRSRVHRANVQAQFQRRIRKTSPTVSAAEQEREAEEYARRWAKLCPSQGYCPYCGNDVDEAGGKLHDPYCAVEPTRRAS